MATNAAKHLLVRESVDEIKISQQEQHIQAEVICRMPVTKPFKPTKISKKFDCEYPTVDPNVSRVSQPLPFPDTLADTIAWTDAFVDRIASMTAAQEKKTIKDMTLLAGEIERLRTVLATTEVALDQSRTETQKAQDETKSVRTALAASEAKSKVQTQTIKDMQAHADKEAAEEKLLRQQIRTLTSENTDLLAKLGKADKALADEHVRLTKEQKKHHQDHEDLKKEHELLEVAKRDLAKIKVDLDQVKIESAAKDKTIEGLDAEIVCLKRDRDDTDKSNRALQTELAATKKKLAASEHSHDEAKTAVAALTVEIAAAKERISILDGKLQTTEASFCALEKNIKKITDEKEVVSAELSKMQIDLTQANAEITTLKTSLQDANTKVAGLESSLKTSEEGAKKMKAAMLQAKAEKKAAVEARDAAIKALQSEEATHDVELEGERAAAGLGSDGSAKLQEADKKLEEAKKSAEELQSKVTALEKRLIPAAPSSFNSKRVNILSVEYGGKAYTSTKNADIYTKLYKHASDDTPFKISNQFFGGDPWQHHEKSCSITYQLDGEGAPLQIVGKEYKELSFVLKK